VRRGEIRWGRPRLPGLESKRRPFLVVSHDLFNRNDLYQKVLVVHLTTTRRAGGPYDWEVDLPRGAAGLRVSSVVKCNEVYTIPKSRLEDLIGTIPSGDLRKVDAALAIALGLSG